MTACDGCDRAPSYTLCEVNSGINNASPQVLVREAARCMGRRLNRGVLSFYSDSSEKWNL